MESTNYIFIAEVIEMYVQEEILTKKRLDYDKITPSLYTRDNRYRAMGNINHRQYL